MSDPIASIVRFSGEPDDLLERFERACQLWAEAQDGYTPPAFYAACRTDDGIAIVTGWKSVADHEAFGRRMGPHLEAAGMGKPDRHEHLRIEKLGWD